MVCLVLQNVPPSLSESKLRWMCNCFGKVLSVCLMKHLFTNEANGLALVQMRDMQQGMFACDAFDGWTLDGHCLSATIYPGPCA